MNKFLILLCAGMTAALSLFATEKPPASDEFITIRYVRVIDAFRILNKAMPEGAASVISLDPKTNSMVLDATDPNYKKVREFLIEIDQRPKQIVHRAVLSEVVGTGKDQKERIISRPTVYTLEGRPAVFFLPCDGKILKFTVPTEEVNWIETPHGSLLGR